MKKRIIVGMFSLGLFASGVALGGLFDIPNVIKFNEEAKVSDYPQLAADAYADAQSLLDGQTPSAPQTTQIHTELQSRLMVMQVKQNAEIIRLLTEINKKK